MDEQMAMERRAERVQADRTRTGTSTSNGTSTRDSNGTNGPALVDVEEQRRIELEITRRQSRLLAEASSSVFPTAPPPPPPPSRVGPTMATASAPPSSPPPRPESAPSPPRVFGYPHGDAFAHFDDEEYARKLEQQFRDEELARSMQDRETSDNVAALSAARYGGRTRGGGGRDPSPSPSPTMAPAATDAETRAAIRAAQRDLDREAARDARRKRCTLRYILCRLLLPMVFVAVIVWVLVYFLTGKSIVPGINPDDIELPPFFTDNWGKWGPEHGYDPEAGTGDYGPFQKWTSPPATNDSTGLDLAVINALTDEWFTYFNNAIDDWQGGTPRALKLTVRVASEASSSCDHVTGVMIVCNGDYGRTGWTGLNEVQFERNRIVSSVARMNEFYLRNAGNEERRYTMCHELGHGYGLPHRDENVNNADLGTCLDYTNRPGNNMQPDKVDFANLVGLYGTVPSGRRRRRALRGEAGRQPKRTRRQPKLTRRQEPLLSRKERSKEELITKDMTVKKGGLQTHDKENSKIDEEEMPHGSNALGATTPTWEKLSSSWWWWWSSSSSSSSSSSKEYIQTVPDGINVDIGIGKKDDFDPYWRSGLLSSGTFGKFGNDDNDKSNGGGNGNKRNGARILHTSNRGEAHEYDLGNGRKIIARFLFPRDEETTALVPSKSASASASASALEASRNTGGR